MSKIVGKLRAFCKSKEEYAALCSVLPEEAVDITMQAEEGDRVNGSAKLIPSGYVYLVKSGRRYKIGMTASRWQRISTLDQQTSEGVDRVIHFIAAIDDAPGIERYWHQRFEEKRVKGEWFDLSAEDIKAFRKRKWMRPMTALQDQLEKITANRRTLIRTAPAVSGFE